jgi:uncharacterized protein (DUF58 family)
MRDEAARTRAGLNRRQGGVRAESRDPRIGADLAHLRQLEGRARAISFLPRQPARSVLHGRHSSRLRGRGLNFEELRAYLPGDDVRAIDWKVTVRTGEPHVRVYTEERDRPALLVVDQRMSMFFGSRLNMKSVTAAETAALAAFRILDQGDRVGGVVFGDDLVAELRPQRSRKAVDLLLTAIADANALLRADADAVEPMPLNRPLESVAKIARRDHLVIIVSDFDGIDARTKTLLGGITRHNDVVLGVVTDPMAVEMPEPSQLVISDGALQAEIDTRDGKVRKALSDMSSGRIAQIMAWERELGIPVLPLSAGEPTLPQIRRLMGISGRRR